MDGTERRIRFHDYHEIYNIPGLYEHIFYEKLECQSPALMAKLIEHEVKRGGEELESLNVLDVGAGNGIMGEMLSDVGVNHMVGVDILPEAARAAERDRPGLYEEYYPADLLNPPKEVETELSGRNFNCLTMIAALGFGDIPPEVFATAFNYVEDGGYIAFNLMDEFLEGKDPSGFAEMIEYITDSGTLEESMRVHYIHRLSISGDPIYYQGIIGRKGSDISGGFLRK
ncbi:MAG: methyltransferase domain-containing protein [bacterium]